MASRKFHVLPVPMPEVLQERTKLDLPITRNVRVPHQPPIPHIPHIRLKDTGPVVGDKGLEDRGSLDPDSAAYLEHGLPVPL